MRFVETINLFLKRSLGSSYNYVSLIILSIISFMIIKLIIKIFSLLFARFLKDPKKIYILNKRVSIFFNILNWIIIFFIWENHIKSLITLISFVSAAITISLREIIFNFFAGIYIKAVKPFRVEDRIEVTDIEGDVVNINALNFEVLEISKKDEGEQSTGIIVQFPNSTVFTSPLKNYVKAFKYIWKEISIKLPLDADIKKCKGILYKIINQNEVIKSIPNKMDNQISNASTNYRIYYNKLDPVIYTKVVDDYILLSLRFLTHPKKARMVEDDIWCSILNEYKNGELPLYKK